VENFKDPRIFWRKALFSAIIGFLLLIMLFVIAREDSKEHSTLRNVDHPVTVEFKGGEYIAVFFFPKEITQMRVTCDQSFVNVSYETPDDGVVGPIVYDGGEIAPDEHVSNATPKQIPVQRITGFRLAWSEVVHPLSCPTRAAVHLHVAALYF